MTTMKKTYISPEIVVNEISASQIICASQIGFNNMPIDANNADAPDFNGFFDE